mgnify:CR=1 FL=1
MQETNPKDAELDKWLMDGQAEQPIVQPPPQQRFVISVDEWTRANNTRFLAAGQLRTAMSIADEEMKQQARQIARRARAVMDDTAKAAREAWDALSGQEREDLVKQLQPDLVRGLALAVPAASKPSANGKGNRAVAAGPRESK